MRDGPTQYIASTLSNAWRLHYGQAVTWPRWSSQPPDREAHRSQQAMDDQHHRAGSLNNRHLLLESGGRTAKIKVQRRPVFPAAVGGLWPWSRGLLSEDREHFSYRDTVP